MSTDFVLLPEKPAPQDVLARLVHMFPGFAAHWNQSANLNKNPDGSYTVHGVFTELGRYIREHFNTIDSKACAELFRFVEECVNTQPHSSGGVSNAACTCFLEDLAGKGDLSQAIRGYLGLSSRAYFDQWNA